MSITSARNGEHNIHTPLIFSMVLYSNNMNDFIIIKPTKTKRKTLIEYFVHLPIHNKHRNRDW